MHRPDRHIHDWLYSTIAHVRRMANAVRQWMDASDGTPFLQESSSNISSHKQSISNQKGMMKHGYVLYPLDGSVNCQVPCLARYPPFNALSTSSAWRSPTLFSLNFRKPRFNINHLNTIWRMARSSPISSIAEPVYQSVLSIILWRRGFRLPCTSNGIRRCKIKLRASYECRTSMCGYGDLVMVM